MGAHVPTNPLAVAHVASIVTLRSKGRNEEYTLTLPSELTHMKSFITNKEVITLAVVTVYTYAHLPSSQT